MPDLCPTPRISVVIATYKRPRELDRCLAALLDQSIAGSEYEVVVADDSASESEILTDTCAQIATWNERFTARRSSIRCMPVVATQGPAAARNAGWRTARANLIAFTDDDTIPSREWLEQALHYFEDGGLAAVSGRIVVPLREQPTDYERNVAGLEHCPFVTANCFYRRAVLESVGGFDERFTMAWREDTDLWFAVLSNGGRCIEVSDCVVEHPVRPAPWGISIREQKKTLFNALLWKKHRDLCREKNILARNPRYYAIAASIVLSVVGLTPLLPRSSSQASYASNSIFATPLTLPSGAWLFWLALWILLTLEFAFRRLTGTSHSASHIGEMLATSAIIPVLSLFWRIVGSVKFRTFYI